MARRLTCFESVPCLLVLVLFFLNYPLVNSNKNVLLIIVPNFRFLFISSVQHRPYTPVLNMLSSQCLNFHNTFSQIPTAVPSRDSLFTSRRPDTLKSYDDTGQWGNENFITIPEYFESNGYHTLAFGKVFPLGTCSNSSDHGSKWSQTPFWPQAAKYDNESSCLYCDIKFKFRLKSNLVCPIFPNLSSHRYLPDEEIIYAARSYIKAFNNSSEQFFLTVGFFRPEVPFRFPIKYFKLNPEKHVLFPKNFVRPGEVPSVACNPANKYRQFFDVQEMNWTYPFGTMKYNDTRLIKQSYFATVTYIDDLIGQLIKELIDNNLYQKTVIALTGDHGCSLGERGLWGGHSCYDNAIKVPFLICAPQITTEMRFRKISHQLVELVDIFPTLVDLAGLKPLPQCPENSTGVSFCTEGVSLLPLIQSYVKHPEIIKERNKNWKVAIFSQVPRPGPVPTNLIDSDIPPATNITIMGYAVRTLRYKYVEWVKFTGMQPDWKQVLTSELYDFDLDPTECLNLAAKPQLAHVVLKLKSVLHAGWRASLPKIIDHETNGNDTVTTQSPDNRTVFKESELTDKKLDVKSKKLKIQPIEKN